MIDLLSLRKFRARAQTFKDGLCYHAANEDYQHRKNPLDFQCQNAASKCAKWHFFQKSTLERKWTESPKILVWFSACNLELPNCKKGANYDPAYFSRKCHFDGVVNNQHKIQCAFDHQYSHYFCGRLPGVAIVKFAWREEWQNWFLTFRSDAPHLTWRIPLEIDEFLRGPFSLLTTVS